VPAALGEPFPPFEVDVEADDAKEDDNTLTVTRKYPPSEADSDDGGWAAVLGRGGSGGCSELGVPLWECEWVLGEVTDDEGSEMTDDRRRGRVCRWTSCEVPDGVDGGDL
jgi:hypothetical protein